MKKIITFFSVILYASNALAQTAVIVNNSHHQNMMTVYFKECGRPFSKDHLDCLPGLNSVVIPDGASSSLMTDAGYFMNIVHTIEQDQAGHIKAETHYNTQNRCELFDKVILADDDAGRIVCSYA